MINATLKNKSVNLSGYIQSNSIMKLVLALKANAMPRRSLTKPTKVLYK